MTKLFAKCDKQFISDIDRFLAEFDAKNPQRSESQQREITKFSRIFQWRDMLTEKSASEMQDEVWEGFL